MNLFSLDHNDMKALLFSLALVLTVSAGSLAQTQKGRWTIGAQLGNFSYQKQKNDYRNFTGSLTPQAGYFIANGLVVGTGIPFSFSSTKFGNLFLPFDNLRQTGSSIGLSPFVRYYVGVAKLKPFAGLAYRYSFTTSKDKTDTAGGSVSITKGHSSSLVPTLGMAYFVTPTLGLTASLNYNINHTEYDRVQSSPYTPGPSLANFTSRSVSLDLGFQLFIGK